MKINLHIIKSDLGDLALDGTLSSNPYASTVSFASTPHSNEKLRTDCLYVIAASELSRIVDAIPQGASIVCLGTPPQSALNQIPKIDILWTDIAANAPAVIERVNELIAEYSQWCEDINDLLARNKSLRTIAERSESVFKAPLWMWDAQFQTVFHVATADNYSFPEQYKMHLDGTPWPISEVNVIDDVFRESQMARLPYTLPPVFGYSSLCYNLFEGDQLVATISIDNLSDKDFSARDRFLLKYLGDKMKAALKFEAHFSKYATYLANDCLERLLSREVVLRSDAYRALDTLGWGVDDPYFCIFIEQRPGATYPDIFLIPTAEAISDIVTSSLFHVSHGSILFIVNLNLAKGNLLEIAEQILRVIKGKKLNMAMGCSTPFYDFLMTPFFCEQAREALHLGEARQPNEEVHSFKDYILDSVVQKCLDNTVPEAFLHPAIPKLIRYDAAHDGNLLDTLRIYLRNGMSAKKTSEALFIHRNTLLTRLKAIENVGRVSLEDYDTRLQLSLAFLFLRPRA